MAGLHPVQFTTTVKCSGLAFTDKEIPLRINSGAFTKTVNDSRIAGKLIAVEKADTGKTPTLCTVEYAGVIRFAIDDGVTLDDTALDRGVKGAASGGIKIVAYSSASPAVYDPNIVGRIIAYSNTTGNKYIDVLMPAQ